jgi:uncharacterized CHY-type Zn-finger protein
MSADRLTNSLPYRLTEGGTAVHGATIDNQTRCVHYATVTDVIAIKFYCCRLYYPCHLCHEMSAGHQAEQWPKSLHDQRALLCGVCSTELTITAYFDLSACPNCSAPFNDGCRRHRQLYFAD